MSPTLEGEIAIVTGAGKGIGEAIAHALASAGARVAVTSRLAEDAERVAAALGPEHVGLGMDVRESAAVDAAVAAAAAALGTPTILVNNAGVNCIGPSESYPDDEWERILDVNLTGVFRCCRAAGARMLEAGHGSIVNVASIVGATWGCRGAPPTRRARPASSASPERSRSSGPGAACASTRSCPGPCSRRWSPSRSTQGVVDPQGVVDHTPAGRWALPEDIAGAALLLCSPAGGFMTGQAIVVDGGYSTFGAAHAASRRFEGECSLRIIPPVKATA